MKVSKHLLRLGKTLMRMLHKGNHAKYRKNSQTNAHSTSYRTPIPKISFWCSLWLNSDKNISNHFQVSFFYNLPKFCSSDTTGIFRFSSSVYCCFSSSCLYDRIFIIYLHLWSVWKQWKQGWYLIKGWSSWLLRQPTTEPIRIPNSSWTPCWSESCFCLFMGLNPPRAAPEAQSVH